MIAFLLTLLSVADATPIGASSPQDKVAQQCSARVAQKVNGEISNFAVTKSTRTRSRLVVEGTVSTLIGATPVPGEMTPNHVRRLDYTFQCRWSGRRGPSVRLVPLHD